LNPWPLAFRANAPTWHSKHAGSNFNAEKTWINKWKLYREMHIVAASSSLPMPVTAKLERG